MAIEDAVYAFLAGDMPFAASAPTHTIVIESLSKRLAPGITLGMLCVPPIMKERVASELRTGGWQPTGSHSPQLLAGYLMGLLSG